MPVVPPMDDIRPSSRGSSSQREGSSRPAAPAGKQDKKSGSTPNGNGNGNGNGKEKGWLEGVDYAYEYVPVAQRRQGRKNM
ncbi:hypothetical protein I302_100980 [Kwoniella bestiolae CBS 10118]|uniref:Uncharacterized protein n=1 Tax=Kwoniella bestiolae CBS 10118 TaxID=1296100 RepID=A0A1B9G6N4_9TREE|nr:hypothetical protein I302_04357 [Kwoniella bestiolae CBS 10118]OCF26670.1 hypothetical protein I302_04357 [Kwoniella bestiolae CBS 10118]